MPSASMSTMRACGSNPPLRPSAYFRVLALTIPCRTPTEPRLPIPRGLPSSLPSTLRRSLPFSSMTNRGRRSWNAGSMYVSHRSSGSRMWPSASITLYARAIGHPSKGSEARHILLRPPRSRAENIAVDRPRDAVFVDGRDDSVGHPPDGLGCVAHRQAEPGPLEHRDVVLFVTDGDHLVTPDSQGIGQCRESDPFAESGRNHFAYRDVRAYECERLPEMTGHARQLAIDNRRISEEHDLRRWSLAGDRGEVRGDHHLCGIGSSPAPPEAREFRPVPEDVELVVDLREDAHARIVKHRDRLGRQRPRQRHVMQHIQRDTVFD